MAITTIFDPTKFRVSIQEMIFEWLTDALGDSVSEITTNTIKDEDLEKLDKSICQYKVSSPSSRSTGAGALNREAVFKNVTVTIGFKARSQVEELELDLLDDILLAYMQSPDPTKGRKALGVAGLRSGLLTGPMDNNSKIYYLHRWILSVRVLTQGVAP